MGDSLLLDTHVWLWYVQGNPQQLQDKTIHQLNQAGEEGRLGLSAMSIWEVAMLQAKGRVQLAQNCLTWVQQAMRGSRVRLIPLSPAIAVESCHLPGEIHRDPCDRILVASARVEGITLVTRDRLLLDYATQGHLKAIAT
jgi:PIN domain nuclease of toxin-antitoxin system